MSKVFSFFTTAMMIATLVGVAIFGVAIADEKHHTHWQYQKPGAPIRLAAPDFIYLDAHSSGDFEVSFTTPKNGELQLQAKAKEGLIMIPLGVMNFDLASETATASLSLTSADEGRYHVMFYASMTINGQTNSRVFGVPVYVGEMNSASQKPKQHPSHIVLPAEETIRPAKPR